MVLKPCKSLDKLPTSTGAGEKKAWLLLDAWLEGALEAAVSGSCFHSAQVVATEPPRSEQGGLGRLFCEAVLPVAGGALHFGVQLDANVLVKGEISFLQFL